MSEDFYRMKVTFNEMEEAEAALPKVEAILERFLEYSDHYHKMREGSRPSIEEAKIADQVLREQYPDVLALVPAPEQEHGFLGLNYLSYIQPLGDYDVSLRFFCIFITGTASDAADLRPLAQAIMKLGAAEVACAGEQELISQIDFWEMLDDADLRISAV